MYLTGNSAGGSRFDDLVDLVNETDLNAMVIDIKNDHGNVTFKLDGTEFDDISKNYISDPEEMMEVLYENEIYPIARIVVFKDSVLPEEHPEFGFKNYNGSVWKNNSGEAFTNPFMEEVWEYNLDIAELAAEMGFQEIQFDYVRFPDGFGSRDEKLDYSFGNYTEEELTPRIEEEWEEMLDETDGEKPEFTNNNIDKEDIEDELDKENKDKEPKEDDWEELSPPEYNYGLARVMAVTDFVEYANDRLKDYDVDVSVDIFGYTATVPESRGIGQNFYKISEHVDVISSMIYPSHWGPGSFGIDAPDLYPYELIEKYSKTENELLDELDNPPVSRPWLQDFTASWLGTKGVNYLNYGKEEVEAQIKALHENGIDEYLLWDPSNRYTRGVDFLPLED
ncbi:GTP-binding protein [Natranaerobius trueperi]|uniref:GTP-binding protein n=1 Tax=Natranaerobius trueperi TaxID=759412 RepID=A0A226BXP6_9FIRM|nr:GTP-binding protein [Natranaerobius trueperi]